MITKRLITIITMLCMVVIANAQGISSLPLISFPSDYTYPVWDGNEFVIASYAVDGKDVTYTILNNDLTIQKTFTLKNIIKTGTIGEGETSQEYEMQSPAILECKGITETIAIRNFFTEDDKWCVFITNRYLKDEFFIDNDVLSIYNEDGIKVGEIPYTGLGRSGFWFINTPDNKPHYYTKGNGKIIFWDFEMTSGRLEAKERTTLSGYPNPLTMGDPFTIELPDPSDDHTFVTVTDMNGRQIYRAQMASSNNSTTFTINNASAGILIYTVIYGNGKSISGRLIAK